MSVLSYASRQPSAVPTWARGFADDVWGRRLAQPTHDCWTDTEATPTLQARTPATEDADAKALACAGLRVRPGPQQADPRWRRCGAGRPGRAVTLDGLGWGSA